MSKPAGWGRSHQTKRWRSRNPWWYQAVGYAGLAAWLFAWQTTVGVLVLVIGPLLLLEVVRIAVARSGWSGSTVSGKLLLRSDDPLAAVKEYAQPEGGGPYLGVEPSGKLRFARSQRAVLLLGPPRSGKTSAVIVPALIAHHGPAVCTSTKTDVAGFSWPARQRSGRLWLDYSVGRVAMIRQRVDSKTVIHAKPTAVIATSWRHTTARAVEGQPPDPQLHSHVLLHGAVRRDGRIVAIDSRSRLVHRREVGAAYRTELARELNQLGFEIQRGTGRGQRYFEVAGVPSALLDRWSSRHHQVQAAIHERLADQESALRAIVTAGGPDGHRAAERLALLKQTGQLAPREERFMSTSTRSAKARSRTGISTTAGARPPADSASPPATLSRCAHRGPS